MYGIARSKAVGHQGYMPGENGPFRCDHCVYFAPADGCDNRIVIGWAKDGKFGLKMRGSFAGVDPDGCSDEFEPR